MADTYDEILDLPPDNYFQVPNMYIDDLILYLTSDEFKVLMYMVRNVSGRRTWKHHSLAISVFVNGRQLEKSFCVGIGMKEGLVRKCLQSLAKYGFIEPLGVPTLMGQNWKLGSKIKMGELRKRLDEKLVLDMSKIKGARANRGKKKDTPLVTQNPSCDTEPLLLDKTSPVLSNKRSPLLLDKTHRKTEERQIRKTEKENYLMRANAAHDNTSPLSDPDALLEDAEAYSPLPIGKMAQAKRVSNAEAKLQKATTNPLPKGSAQKVSPAGAEPPKRTPTPRQIEQTAAMNALAQAMGVTLAKSDEKRYAQIAATLVGSGITYAEFDLYVRRIRKKAAEQNNWEVTPDSLIAKGRPTEYVTAREKSRQKGQGRVGNDVQVLSMLEGPKNVYNPHLDPAYAPQEKESTR